MSDPEDLEDGEIEDDEDDVVQPVDPPLIPPTPNDYQEHEPKPGDQQQSSEVEAKPAPEANRSGSSNREHQHTNHGNKSSRSSSKPPPVVDDWATKVENAIANALIKDGVQPPMPSSIIHPNEAEGEGHGPVSSSRRSKKRKKPSRGSGGDHHHHVAKQPRITELGNETEVDLEYEMLNVRGSSPQAIQGVAGGGRESGHSESEGEDTHYSSDESGARDRDGHFRAGSGRRDRETRERDQRERERERDREREREREYNRKKRKQQRQRGNNKTNRDGRKRKRDDSDDEKHRPTGPRKMELCKFYLMDCCAKREKCLYMHKDFPCKYYYLGLKCKDKDKCLFSHGEALSDDLRMILLKHLETAPQEILGDFQRISRDNAITMLNATQRQLLDRYGNKGDTSARGGGGGGGKIPSLLDVVTVQPPGSMHSPKNSRKSRWCDTRQDDDRGRSSDGEPMGDADDGDVMRQLAGVITPAQISDLEQMGIRTLDEISQLTVAQLNELGLSITQIHDLQVRAMNVQKQLMSGKQRQVAQPVKDLDLRMLPGAMEATEAASVAEQHQHPATGGNKKDVDMRILPPEPEPERAGTGNGGGDEEEGGLLHKPPTVDYSQYIKDSNLDEEDLDAVAADSSCLLNDPEEDDDDDDENNLKISIEEDEEDDKKKDSEDSLAMRQDTVGRGVEAETGKISPLPPLVPPKIDYAQGLGDILSAFGGATDKSAHRSPNVSPRAHRSPSPVGKDAPLPGLSDVWTPSMADSSSAIVTGSSIGIPTQPMKPSGKTNSSKRSGGSSIYDWYSSDNASSPDAEGRNSPLGGSLRYGSNTLLPLDLGESDLYGSTTGSTGGGEASNELGFPFKSMMANYVPATEIDGSIGSHAPIHYKVFMVDVPRPNFGPLRRSMTRPIGTKDPRLRRLFGLQSDDDNDADDTSDGIKSPDANPVASPLYGMGSPRSLHGTASLPAAAVTPTSKPPAISSGPRVDPRKRHAEKQQLEAAQQQQSFGSLKTAGPPASNTPQIDVQVILQKSLWYKDLGSKHKIMVNQQLAILSTEMKKYHNSDRSTEHLSEFMKFLGTNNMLQHILTCLNVFVDDSVTFCEVPVVPNLPPPNISLPPNIPPPAMGGPVPSMQQLPRPVHVPPPHGGMGGGRGDGGGGGGGGGPHMSLPSHQGNVPPMFLGGNGPFGQPDQPTSMIRPGLLGVSPNMPFEQFLAMGNINKNDNGGGGGGNNGPLPPWVQGNGNNMRNMRNNNRVGHNFRNNNDRWNNNGGGGGGGGPPMGGNNRRNNNRRMDRKK
ncbi:protein suppressor of sable [Anopheles nili]|uniref:protein suppressor of sable n=1 Tax=Anopheles nili TaxID=185578 RepID=UPI00237B3781|nr:protein suppressor of sable [Anopheles nili]